MATGKVGNVVFYADDPPALAAFWAAVFGVAPGAFEGSLKEQLLASGLTEEQLAKRGLVEDPSGGSPRLFFHHAARPKAPGERNRVHLDVQATPGRHPTDEELEAEKDRLVALGAEVVRLIDQDWGPWHEHYPRARPSRHDSGAPEPAPGPNQPRDPEGNEFCLQ